MDEYVRECLARCTVGRKPKWVFLRTRAERVDEQ